MMYFIQSINTWKPANEKCRQSLDFIHQYEDCIIADQLSLDALIEEIRHKVGELNVQYPRTKPLVVRHNGYFVSCSPEDRGAEGQYVFSFFIHRVKRTFKFAEPAPAQALKEGGRS
jgi:hypothetical protein